MLRGITLDGVDLRGRPVQFAKLDLELGDLLPCNFEQCEAGAAWALPCHGGCGKRFDICEEHRELVDAAATRRDLGPQPCGRCGHAFAWPPEWIAI